MVRFATSSPVRYSLRCVPRAASGCAIAPLQPVAFHAPRRHRRAVQHTERTANHGHKQHQHEHHHPQRGFSSRTPRDSPTSRCGEAKEVAFECNLYSMFCQVKRLDTKDECFDNNYAVVQRAATAAFLGEFGCCAAFPLFFRGLL